MLLDVKSRVDTMRRGWKLTRQNTSGGRDIEDESKDSVVHLFVSPLSHSITFREAEQFDRSHSRQSRGEIQTAHITKTHISEMNSE